MPTNQPSNDPGNVDAAALPVDARDDRTAAAVMNDDRLDSPPGGGGLTGAGDSGGAIDAPAGTRAAGGASPNAPLPDAMAVDGGTPRAEAEARTRAANDPDGGDVLDR